MTKQGVLYFQHVLSFDDKSVNVIAFTDLTRGLFCTTLNSQQPLWHSIAPAARLVFCGQWAGELCPDSTTNVALDSHNFIYCHQYRKIVTDVSKDRDYLILTAETPVTVRNGGRLKLYQADVLML